MNNTIFKNFLISMLVTIFIVYCCLLDEVFTIHQKSKPVTSNPQTVDSNPIESKPDIIGQSQVFEIPVQKANKPKRSSKRFDEFFSEIKLDVRDGSTSSYEIAEESLKPSKIIFEFDPNKSIIELTPHKNKKFEYKIEEQFETSLTISLEGPVYALENWKHHTSEWKELPSNDYYYGVLSVGLFDSKNFPKVTKDEILKAVFDGCSDKYKKNHKLKKCEFCSFMINYVKDCDDPYSGGCNVSVTTMRFRISVKEKNQWKIIKTLECKIPLGC